MHDKNKDYKSNNRIHWNYFDKKLSFIRFMIDYFIMYAYSIRFRCLGLRGHHAFIQKTANDELQNDAWIYMNQIVPSIVLNM